MPCPVQPGSEVELLDPFAPGGDEADMVAPGLGNRNAKLRQHDTVDEDQVSLGRMQHRHPAKGFEAPPA